MSLLPALLALKDIIPSLLGPPFVCYAASHLLPIQLPRLILASLSLLSVPLFFLSHAAWRRSVNRKEAAKLGAVLPPWVEDSSWLGLGALKAQVAAFDKGYLGDHVVNWSNKYGWTFQTNIFLQDVIVTSEPEYIKSILATNFQSFGKDLKLGVMKDLLGNGVFNADGDTWKFHRGVTRPFFSRERISDFDVFETHTQAALSALRTRLGAGHPVDIQDLVSRFTIDSATDFLFGTDVRSLAAGLPYPHQKDSGKKSDSDRFATAFLDAQVHIARRARFGVVWPFVELFDRSHRANLRTIRGFVEPIVQKAIERAEAAERDAAGEKTNVVEVAEGETMLDYMVKMTRDPVLLRDETLNILLAGRDTTASLLSTAVYALTQHPDVLKTLRAEILNVTGSDRAPTSEDIRSMKYLRAVLNECLRIWPPVPFNGRKSREASVWPSKDGGPPIYVPPNTRCNYSVFVMQRRTDLWGADAGRFDPMRFLDERVSHLTQANFIFLPFNAGPRICLGQQFAYNEASFFMVRLLQRYQDFELVRDAQPSETLPRPGWEEEGKEKVWMKSHLTLYCNGGVWVKAKPTESE